MNVSPSVDDDEVEMLVVSRRGKTAREERRCCRGVYRTCGSSLQSVVEKVCDVRDGRIPKIFVREQPSKFGGWGGSEPIERSPDVPPSFHVMRQVRSTPGNFGLT